MEEKRKREEGRKRRTLSRRELFPLAGKVAVGAAGLSVVTAGGLALGCGSDDGDDTSAAGGETKAATSASTASEWPWPYETLDADASMPIAYENWFEKFCCYATVSGIVEQLRKSVGEPYVSWPMDSTKWGHGGAVGWGTLCGTLTGAGIVTGLVAGEEGEDILNDVIAWYTTTELPIYQPPEPKAQITSTSRSDSPLCHVSVGKWMKKEGVKFFSDPRKDRCARLSADVSAKTIELLNQWIAGSYTPTAPSQIKKNEVQMPAQDNCTECHGDSVPASPGI